MIIKDKNSQVRTTLMLNKKYKKSKKNVVKTTMEGEIETEFFV
jgi:hypothetical protein